MPNPTRIWQMISLILACALNAALFELNQQANRAPPAKGTLPTVNYHVTGYEPPALSPNARRAQERYSL